MQIAKFLKGGLSFLAFAQCQAAVTWTTIGCEGITVQGASIDDMWDNAVLMAQNAVSSINMVVNADTIVPLTKTSRGADNAKAMFGAKFGFSKITGLDDASKVRLNEVSGVYGAVQGLMSGNAGYFFCTGNSLTWGVVGDYTTGVWHYSIPGTEDTIILQFSAGNSQGENSRPCTDGKTLGQTFRGNYMSNDQILGSVNGILFCTNQFTSDYHGMLNLDYSTSGSPPNPDDYKSASGTILHEMIHAIDTTKYLDQENAQFGQGVKGYGYNRCYYLALTEIEDALVNPDNYRVFAEMCMSISTRWGSPKIPAPQTRFRGRRATEVDDIWKEIHM